MTKRLIAPGLLLLLASACSDGASGPARDPAPPSTTQPQAVSNAPSPAPAPANAPAAPQAAAPLVAAASLADNRADLRALILGIDKVSVDPPSAGPMKDATTSVEGSGTKQFKVSTQSMQATYQFEQATAFDPNADSLWPGSTIQGKSIGSGVLAPIALKRNPGSVTITNLTAKDPNALYSAEVARPTAASVAGAIQGLVTQHVDFTSGAKESLDIREFHSIEQAFAQLGVSAKWVSGSVRASLDSTNYASTTNYIVRYTQAYYTASFSAPSTPEAFFAPDVPLADLALYMHPESDGKKLNPPAYVSSVTYGRTLYFIFSSSEEASSLRAKIEADFSYAVTSASISAAAGRESQLKNVETKVLVQGGAGDAFVDLLSGDKIAGLVKYIRAGANFSPSSPGVPISYEMRYLKDNDIARLSFASTYDVRTQAPVAVQRFHLTLNTENDDKDREEPVEIWLLAPGGLVLGYQKVGVNEVWPDNTSRGYDFAAPAGTNFSDCNKWSIRIRKSPDGSDQGAGWNMSFDLNAYLETDTAPRAVASMGHREVGDGHDFDFGVNFNCGN